MKYLLGSILLLSVLAGCGFDWFPGPGSSVVVTTTTLPNATTGTAYSQTLTAFGGTAPYSWSVTSGSLPAGLALSTAGVISGTPSSVGTSTFTVQVTDSATPAVSGSAPLTLQVLAASVPQTILPGQSITLSSGQSVLVPAGTTITAPGGGVTTVTGDNTVMTVATGSVVIVPSTAIGLADNTITAQ